MYRLLLTIFSIRLCPPNSLNRYGIGGGIRITGGYFILMFTSHSFLKNISLNSFHRHPNLNCNCYVSPLDTLLSLLNNLYRLNRSSSLQCRFLFIQISCSFLAVSSAICFSYLAHNLSNALLIFKLL